MPGALSVRRPRREGTPLADPAYSYRVGWLKEARTWDSVRRSAVADGLRAVLGAPDFSPNESRRRYRLPALDESLHAGASLVALQEVLVALETER